MNVIIRADASIHIGSGHVMRCLVLAEALLEKAHSVSFVCRSQPGDMINFIQERGFDVFSLDEIIPVIQPQSSADYLGWLQCSIEDDASAFLLKIKSADIVITDHYAIGKEWQSIIRKQLDCRIMAIDDLERKHDADLVIDQTFGRKKKSYPNISRALTGTQYALLNPNFSVLHELAYQRVAPLESIRVLVSMGGIDSPNATLLVLKQLSKLVNITVTVLLSTRAPHYISVNSFCQTKSNIKHIGFVSNMAQEMMKHDVSIGAPGATSWERACLGLPSIIIPLAENQREICERLVEAKVAVKVNVNDIDDQLINAFCDLLKSWEYYHQNNLSLCDGKGTLRVMTAIEKWNNESNDYL